MTTFTKTTFWILVLVMGSSMIMLPEAADEQMKDQPVIDSGINDRMAISDYDIIAFQAQTPPVVDGIDDDACWDSATWVNMDKLWLGEQVDSTDFWGRFKVTWTAEKLYLLVEINDNVLNDDFEDVTDNYWNDDCLEIFLDENNVHENHREGAESFNAFAYHIAIDSNVVDIGPEGATTFNDHVEVAIRNTHEDFYVWEMAIDVYDDSYSLHDDNIPVTLTKGKEMGLSAAYCDNDGTRTRETFMGSTVNENGQDMHWQITDYFGDLILVETLEDLQEPPEEPTGISSNTLEQPEIYPNPVEQGKLYFPVRTGNIENIQVFDLHGKKLLFIQHLEQGHIDVSHLDAGTYIVSYRASNLQTQQKFIIQK